MSAHNGLTSQPLPKMLSNALYPLTKEKGTVLPWDVEDHHVMKRLRSTKTDGLCWSSGMKRNAIRHSLAHLSAQGMTMHLALIQNISKIPFLWKKKNLSLTMKYIFTNFLGHPWQTKLRTVTGTNKWTLDSHLKITQNRNNLPRITQTTITWNLNTATKTRLKNTTNNRRRVAGKLYNFRGNKTELMY